MLKEQNKHIETDVVIIGGGPVGIFAAYQLHLLNMNSIVVDSKPYSGGQCSFLYPDKYIYDIPGFTKIKAKDLIQNLEDQCLKNQTQFIGDFFASSIDSTEDGFIVQSNSNISIHCKSVIIATGGGQLEPKRIALKEPYREGEKEIKYHVENESELRDSNILISGGGDSAADWAIQLAKSAKKVYLVHRRDKMRCHPSSFEKIMNLNNSENFHFLPFFQLQQINATKSKGSKKTAIIEDFDGQSKHLDIDHVFAFFGLSSDNSFLENFNIELDYIKNIKVNIATMSTSREGIYAIGDACTYEGKLKLILTGFSEAAIAARSCYSHIFKKKPRFMHSTDIKK